MQSSGRNVAYSDMTLVWKLYIRSGHYWFKRMRDSCFRDDESKERMRSLDWRQDKDLSLSYIDSENRGSIYSQIS